MWSDENEFRKALADMHIDDAPRRSHQELLRKRVLGEFDAAMDREPLFEQTGRFVRAGRRIMRNRILQIATVMAAAACLAVAILWPFGPGTGVALARVQQIVSQVKTVCFDLTTWHDGQVEGAAKVSLMEPGKMRAEWPGMTAIYDWNEGKILVLASEDKSAHAGKVTDSENPYQRNWLEALKSIVFCPQARELGQKQLDGRPAKGWSVPDQDGVCSVWVDAATGELLEAEFQLGRNKIVMSNLVLNPELDESLFAMTPPADYRLETNFEMTEKDPSESDIILLLEVWASGNGDQFPDRLDAARFPGAAAKADWRKLGIDTQEKGEAARKSIGQAFYLLYSGKLEWGYVGSGVKAGQAGHPVLWHRAAGLQKYRVIFADFTVQEVSAERLAELTPQNSAPNNR